MHEPAQWPAVAAAGFAAVAAGASWASVWQSRRERIVAQIPELHLEVAEDLDTRQLRLHVSSTGGLAKRVRFLVVYDGKVAFGYPGPTSTFQPGESRLIITSLAAGGNKLVPGFVACWDSSLTHFYVWPNDGKRRVLTKKHLNRQEFSNASLMTRLYPTIDFATLAIVPFEPVERLI